MLIHINIPNTLKIYVPKYKLQYLNMQCINSQYFKYLRYCQKKLARDQKTAKKFTYHKHKLLI